MSTDVIVVYNEAILRDPRIFVQEVVTRNFRELAQKVAGWIKDHAPKDLDEFRRGVVTLIEMEGLDILAHVRATARHSWFVEHGRGPGGFPPRELMLAWVHRHLSEGQNFNITIRHRQLFQRGTSRYNRGRGGLHVYRSIFAPLTEPRMKLDELRRAHASEEYLISRKIARQGLPGFHLFSEVLRAQRAQIEITASRIGAEISTGLWA